MDVKCYKCEWFVRHAPMQDGDVAETGMCHLEPRELKKYVYSWCSHFTKKEMI